MDDLQKRHVITYMLAGHGKLIKYKIIGWEKHNRILDYNAPCQKDTGFFFLSVYTANELISSGKVSEVDAMIDLWINTVYNDKKVECSEDAPVVYIRNGSGSPLTGYPELSKRWGVSKSIAGRYLNKLDALVQKEKGSHKCIFINIVGIYNKRKYPSARMLLSGGK